MFSKPKKIKKFVFTHLFAFAGNATECCGVKIHNDCIFKLCFCFMKQARIIDTGKI